MFHSLSNRSDSPVRGAYQAGPRQYGAALYVHPSTGRIDFHLQPNVLTEGDRAAGAFSRRVGLGHPYAVTLRLDSAVKMPVAQRLARLALEDGTAATAER